MANEDKDEGKKPGNDDRLDKLETIVTNMAGAVTNMQNTISSMSTNSNKNDDKGDGKEQPFKEPEDIERLSRNEFAEYLMNKMAHNMKAILDPITNKIEDVDKSTMEDRLRAEIRELKKDPENADFDKWSDEIKSNLTSNPNLSVTDALTLARAKDPGKSDALAKEFKIRGYSSDNDNGGSDDNDGKDKNKGDGKSSSDGSNNNNANNGKGKGDGKSFGGMTPAGSGDESEGGKMSTSDAMNKAFDDVLGNHEGVEEMLSGN